jgi:hypothetical protein
MPDLTAIYSQSTRAILWQSTDGNGNVTGGSQGLTPIVLEENAVDELRITDHPVEVGASVNDHAYKMASTIRIKAGWSPVGTTVFIPNPQADKAYLKTIYDALLSLQVNRIVVSLITGKRVYPNMLLETLGLVNDRDTENILLVTADFKEVIFATTQVVSVPPASVQQSPQITQPPTDQGVTAALPGTAANTNALQNTAGDGNTVFNTSGPQQ